MAPDSEKNDPQLMEKMADFAGNNPQTTTGLPGQFQAVTTHGVTSTLAEIWLPTLVMHGELDIYIPLGNGRFQANHIPGAEFENLSQFGAFVLFRASDSRQPAAA